MKGIFTFISKQPIHQEPNHFAIAGLSARDGHGDLIHFQWKKNQQTFVLLDDGHVTVQVIADDFDYDFYRDQNGAQFPGTDVFSTYSLCEVHYDSFIDQDEQLLFDFLDVKFVDDQKPFSIVIPKGFDINN